jgi:predicted nucleotidyltransferase
MQNLKLKQNEEQAIIKLKGALRGKYRILDFCIYGSKARGDAEPDSDIDLMIELEEYTPEIESAIDDLVFDINLAHDCFISTAMFSKKELEEGPLGESPLYKAIAQEGIRI